MNIKLPASFIMDRYSPYAFSSQPVPEEDLMTLFEAARWAPSAFNEQPWRFLYATQEQAEDFDLFLSILVDANKIWARHAPVIGLTVAKMRFIYNGNPNRFGFYDTGQAMGSFLAQATGMGLKVHQMGGYSVEDARRKLNIPENYEPVAMFVIGYAGKTGEFPPEIVKLEERQRTRKPLDEIISLGKFSWQE